MVLEAKFGAAQIDSPPAPEKKNAKNVAPKSPFVPAIDVRRSVEGWPILLICRPTMTPK